MEEKWIFSYYIRDYFVFVTNIWIFRKKGKIQISTDTLFYIYLSFYKSLHGWVPADIEIVDMSKVHCH
jgi:hypothetical protein